MLVKNLQGFINKSFEKREKSFNAYDTLFSSMLTPTELYLSNRIKVKNRARSLVKRTKDNLGKLIIKPADGIERLLYLNASQQEINNQNSIIETSKRNATKDLKYFFEPKKFSVKKALKKLYMSFVGYAKKGYEVAETNTKKVVGTVKLTIHKIIKLGEYIMALTTPQWNMPLMSFKDLDYFSPQMTSNSSTDSESLKYNSAFSALRYRD